MQPSQDRNESTTRQTQQNRSSSEVNPGKLGNDREIDLNRGQSFDRSQAQDQTYAQAGKTPARDQNVSGVSGQKPGAAGTSNFTTEKGAGQTSQAPRQNDRGAQQDRSSRH